MNNSTALNSLYREHHGWLKSWLMRRIGCSFTAADLMQDTFVRVLGADKAEPPREPRSYLATIARGLLIDHFRRRRVEQACLDALAALPPSEVPAPETQALWLEALTELDRLLHGLPPRVRMAFLYAQIENLSYAEVAQRLGVSTSSVKQYLSRAYLHCLPVVQDLE